MKNCRNRILGEVACLYIHIIYHILVLKSPDGEWPITYTFTFTFTYSRFLTFLFYMLKGTSA